MGGGGDRTNSMMSTMSAHPLARANGNGVDPFGNATTPGLRVSIVETVNVLFSAGEVERVLVTGEIALSYRESLNGGEKREPMKIRVNNWEEMEKVAPNAAFLISDSETTSTGGEYLVSPLLTSNTTTVLKYQLRIPAGKETDYVPLKARAVWRCDSNQTRIIIQYSPNPTCVLLSSSSSDSPFDDSTSSAQLEEINFHVPISAPITTFQAKPSAQWSAEKSRLSFVNLEALPLSSTAEAKLLVSVQTEKEAAVQPIGARWRIAGKTLGNVGVELVRGRNGESTTKVDEVRNLVAGKFLVGP